MILRILIFGHQTKLTNFNQMKQNQADLKLFTNYLKSNIIGKYETIAECSNICNFQNRIR